MTRQKCQPHDDEEEAQIVGTNDDVECSYKLAIGGVYHSLRNTAYGIRKTVYGIRFRDWAETMADRADNA